MHKTHSTVQAHNKKCRFQCSLQSATIDLHGPLWALSWKLTFSSDPAYPLSIKTFQWIRDSRFLFEAYLGMLVTVPDESCRASPIPGTLLEPATSCCLASVSSILDARSPCGHHALPYAFIRIHGPPFVFFFCG